MATIVEGNPKAPFSIATTPMCRGGRYSFPGLLYFTLDPYLIMLSVKQGGIKYHFLSLWYDSTWDWTLRPMSGIYIYIYIYNSFKYPLRWQKLLGSARSSSTVLSYRNYVISPGWRLMRAGYRTGLHTLYDKKIYLSIYLSPSTSIYLSINTFIDRSIDLYFYLSIYLSQYKEKKQAKHITKGQQI